MVKLKMRWFRARVCPHQFAKMKIRKAVCQSLGTLRHLISHWGQGEIFVHFHLTCVKGFSTSAVVGRLGDRLLWQSCHFCSSAAVILSLYSFCDFRIWDLCNQRFHRGFLSFWVVIDHFVLLVGRSHLWFQVTLASSGRAKRKMLHICHCCWIFVQWQLWEYNRVWSSTLQRSSTRAICVQRVHEAMMWVCPQPVWGGTRWLPHWRFPTASFDLKRFPRPFGLPEAADAWHLSWRVLSHSWSGLRKWRTLV